MTPCTLQSGDAVPLSPLARSLWAKARDTPKSLWHHMLDAGMCALQLVGEPRFCSAILRVAELMDLSKAQAERLVAYLAANHDGYGKTSPGFQKKAPELCKCFADAGMLSIRDQALGFRHERYGARRYADHAEAFHIPPLPARVFASTVEWHHQGKTGQAADPKKARETWDALGDELHAAIIHVFDPPLAALRGCKHCDAAVMTLLPLVILSDWLASSESFSQLEETMDDPSYIAASEAMARSVVRHAGLLSQQAFPTVTSYQQLWPHFSEDVLRPVQSAILSRADPAAGLTIIEAPMGEGKTEAGAFQAARLCSLWHKQGVYFALPTAATSNQMYTRIQNMLHSLNMGGARLMHGMAWLMGDDSPSLHIDPEDMASAVDWLKPLRRAMLAQSAVGTVDQAMMAAMPVKYGCLRLLGLMGKVLVIDEIHAYDAYMSEIIECLLEWCRVLHIPVLLLSATLTTEKRKSLVAAYGGTLEHPSNAYPLITQVTSGETLQISVDGCAKTGWYRFTPLPLWSVPEALAAHALAKVAHGGCLCVLMNTVAQAQAVWKALRRTAPEDTELLLFHARFKAKQRDALERRCISLFGKDASQRPKKAVLVCTQVVEQSLDLDFDAMVTQLAPIDLLLQRAGRVHRHDRGKRPPGMEEALVEVLVPQAEGYAATGMIYAPWLLEQTQRLLPLTVRIPQDVRTVIESVYQTPEDIPEAWAQMMFANGLMKAQAGGSMLPRPNAERFFGWDLRGERFSMEEPEEGTAAKTRLGDHSMRIALLPGEQIAAFLAAPYDPALAKTAYQNSFTIRQTPLEPAQAAVLQEGAGLCSHLWFVAQEALPVQIGQTRLDYNEEIGAITERMRCE